MLSQAQDISINSFIALFYLIFLNFLRFLQISLNNFSLKGQKRENLKKENIEK